MREKLIQLRKQRNLTQSQVAEAIGVKRATYTGIELGYKNPSLKLAQRIANFFGVNTDYIFFNEIVPKRNDGQMASIYRTA